MQTSVHCLAAVVLSALVAASQTMAQPAIIERPSASTPADGSPIAKALAIADLVLSHHVDPPARQEMILEGAKSLLKAAKIAPPLGLSRRVSNFATSEQLRSFMRELWDEASRSQVPSDQLEASLINGVLSAVPGEPHLISAKELKVNEQLAGNRYIGIGIILAYSKDAGFSQIGDTFKRGPAARAGMKAGELIVSVDGVDTHEMSLAKVVDMLRGEEGSVVAVSVRKPDAREVRTLKITRSVVPRETVVGCEAISDDVWKLRISSSAPIGYLKINEIGGSTVHELRQFEPQLRAQDLQALVLDLRSSSGDLHHTVLLADALLDGGVIGQVRTSTGVRRYEAEPDCLFRDWPIAVLIGNRASGEAEWLAAALQDRKRAVIVGEPTAGKGFTVTPVPMPDNFGAIMLATGLLERADGRSLQRPGSGQPRIQIMRQDSDPKSRDRNGGVYPDHVVQGIAVNSAAVPQFTVRAGETQPKGVVFVENSQIKPAASENSPRRREKPKDLELEKAVEVLQATLKASE